VEPAWMVLGQSAGIAAALAAAQNVKVQELDYARLREQLLAQKQILDLDKVNPAVLPTPVPSDKAP
jgi:FAD dependent oxidoreductase